MAKQLSLSKNWYPWRLRLARSIRRHRDLLPFIGGLIISITLTTRENIQSHYKELSDSIQSAESFYRLEHINQVSLEHVDSLGRELLKKPTVQQAMRDALSEALRKVFGFHDAYVEVPYKLHVLESSIDSTERLVDAVNESNLTSRCSKAKADLKDVHFRYDGLQEKNIQFVQKTLVKLKNGTRLDEAEIKISKEIANEKSKLANDVNHLEKDVEKLTESALSDGKDARERMSRRYEYVAEISWFFYTFGLVLTLTGKMFGAKDDENGVE